MMKITRKIDLSKILFYVICCALLIWIIFFYGFIVAKHHVFPYSIIMHLKDSVARVYDERFTLTHIKPEPWLQATRYDGDGVTIDKSSNDREDFIFLQGLFDEVPELRLIRRDGTVIARWPLKYSDLAADITHLRRKPTTDWNVDSHGAVILPDGSVVFNLDHVGLFKLDRCNNSVWQIDAPTHHSVESNADGSFWVPSSKKYYADMKSPYPLFRPPFYADKLLHVSAGGEILSSFSLVDIFKNSNEIRLLSLTGGIDVGSLPSYRLGHDREIFHLNDVEELPTELAGDFPMFDAGDLLVSLRNRNLLIVVDRDTQRIKWWHIGPWVRQHDPDWRRGGTITVFDNNRDGTETGDILGGSRIIEIDPVTSKSRVIYGGPEEYFYSIRRGKHQILDGSRVLITEAEAGRVFEINSDKQIVWEYVNRYNDTESARITEARAYRSDYFRVNDWTCPPK